MSQKLVITIFLCGDVMIGRGIDQILPHPSDPALTGDIGFPTIMSHLLTA
jgi:poly-gamma-glutamate capsule biosynthesis protein CapA/YwtB (metallophosphatase superfamily)